MAKVALLGLGPVGLATAWGLLERGHTVHAFDANPALVEKCKKGEYPRAEELGRELRAASSRFLIHDSLKSAICVETIIICVGTPAGQQGFELEALRQALVECRAPKGAGGRRHYILRSTLSPGTIQREIFPILQEGEEFELSYYPEFLREKALREDLLDPPIQAAAHTSSSAQERFSMLFPGEFQVLRDFASVEALKIACNAFHALKVVFANEVADLCEKTGASAESVMQAFCADKKLNLSSRYLRPGAPFGGPCLDKDLRALEFTLDSHGIEAGLLRSIRASNEERITKRGLET